MKKLTLLLLYLGHETLTVGAGTEKVLVNMANEFIQRGCQVVLVTNDDAAAVPFFKLLPEVKWLKLSARELTLPWQVKTRREINKTFKFSENPEALYRADVVTAKLQDNLAGIKPDIIVSYEHEAVLVANRLRLEIPKVAMVHNAIPATLGSMNKFQLAEEDKMTLHQVLMPSYIQQAKRYLRGQIIYIPNTVAQVDSGLRADLTAVKPRYTIIAVGRLSPHQKQLHLLLQAFALLADKYPRWEVRIYGQERNKEDLRFLQEIIKKNKLEKRILLCGQTDNITEKLLAADIFAIPSAYEGFCLAQAEAMALGLPAIGFAEADSVNELIIDGENGVLCQPGAQGFAQGLDKLMADQQLRIKMGWRAATAMLEFKPQLVWDRWEELFKNLTGYGQEGTPAAVDLPSTCAKTSKGAFFCDRPAHVFNALNLVYHDVFALRGRADLFMIDNFNGAAELFQKLRTEGIFNKVFLVSPDFDLRPSRKDKRMATFIKNSLKVESPRESLLKNELTNYKITPPVGASDLTYQIIFTPSWQTLIWQEVVTALRKKCDIYFVDDGFFSYCASKIKPQSTTWESQLRKLFKHGKYGFRVKGIFLNNPDLAQYDKDMVLPLPAIKLAETDFVDLVKSVFIKQAQAAVPVVFLEQNVVEALKVDLPELKKRVFSTICQSVLPENLLVRVHPHEKNHSFLLNLGLRLDEGQNMWEAVLALDQNINQRVFISFSSTALVTPKLIFKQEPVVICLYRLLLWQDEERLQETERFFAKIRSYYQDKRKFYIVNSLEELRQILERKAWLHDQR